MPADCNRDCVATIRGGVAWRAFERRVEQRDARLVHEGVKRRERGISPPGRLADRLEEVARSSGAVGARIDVVAHALPELLGPQPRLEHRQDLAALVVGDAIERGVDVVLHDDRVVDAPRRRQPVGQERTAAAVVAGPAGVPSGTILRENLAPHPRGESLVQPDVVPPRRASRGSRTTGARSRARRWRHNAA